MILGNSRETDTTILVISGVVYVICLIVLIILIVHYDNEPHYSHSSYSSYSVKYEGYYKFSDPYYSSVRLFNNYYKIKEMYINGELVKYPSNIASLNYGLNHVVVTLDITHNNTLNGMFYGIKELEKIKFLEGTNTSNIVNMDNLFKDCINLKNVNISLVNTKNVRYMNDIFSGCESLTSLDLSNFDSRNGDKSIGSIDYSYKNLTQFLLRNRGNSEMKVKRNFYENYIKYVPNNWKVEFVD